MADSPIDRPTFRLAFRRSLSRWTRNPTALDRRRSSQQKPRCGHVGPSWLVSLVNVGHVYHVWQIFDLCSFCFFFACIGCMTCGIIWDIWDTDLHFLQHVQLWTQADCLPGGGHWLHGKSLVCHRWFWVSGWVALVKNLFSDIQNTYVTISSQPCLIVRSSTTGCQWLHQSMGMVYLIQRRLQRHIMAHQDSGVSLILVFL